MTNTLNKPTRKRFNILALIFGSVVINYLDRSNLSVAAIGLTDSLQLTEEQMGYIFSAFGVTYAILQIPGGLIADKVAPRLLYSAILVLWSLATLAQGLVNSFLALVGLRAAIGIFEAPSYPINNSIVTRWFPTKERASAIAVYTSGQFVGLAFMTPLLFAIQNYYGWRGLFIISGVVGILWAVVWYLFYRDPKEHKSINSAELEHIEKGGGLINQKAENISYKYTGEDLAQAFIHRKLWGIYIGQFCLGSIFIFFLTWFPTYLVKYRGLGYIESGFLASIPYLAAFCGILLSGFASDSFIKKGFSMEFSRKLPIISGMLLSSVIVGANYTDSTFFIIMFLSLAFFGNAFSSIAWIFVSALAPKHLIGYVGGVFNLMGSLSAVITPTVIGYLVNENDFSPALLFIGALAIIGCLSYIFLVGKVERIEIKSKRNENF